MGSLAGIDTVLGDRVNYAPSNPRHRGSNGLIRVFSLAAVLFAFWLLLSGHFTPFLMISGAVAALFDRVGSARCCGYADDEGHPIELVHRGLLIGPGWSRRP